MDKPCAANLLDKGCSQQNFLAKIMDKPCAANLLYKGCSQRILLAKMMDKPYAPNLLYKGCRQQNFLAKLKGMQNFYQLCQRLNSSHPTSWGFLVKFRFFANFGLFDVLEI